MEISRRRSRRGSRSDGALPRTPGGELAALQTDWLHPNQFGHRRLGEALLPHVREALTRAAEEP